MRASSNSISRDVLILLPEDLNGPELPEDLNGPEMEILALSLYTQLPQPDGRTTLTMAEEFAIVNRDGQEGFLHR